MAVILSLQGCMAVGKTTAVQYVKERRPDIFLSREDNGTVISEVHRRGLIKNSMRVGGAYADEYYMAKFIPRNEGA